MEAKMTIEDVTGTAGMEGASGAMIPELVDLANFAKIEEEARRKTEITIDTPFSEIFKEIVKEHDGDIGELGLRKVAALMEITVRRAFGGEVFDDEMQEKILEAKSQDEIEEIIKE